MESIPASWAINKLSYNYKKLYKYLVSLGICDFLAVAICIILFRNYFKNYWEGSC